MSRMLIASSWMLFSLGLCSCAQETDAPATPAPINQSANSVATPADNVDQLPVNQEAAEQVTENNGPNDQQPISEPDPGSGNPLIDFFRSVDRGVKSTTANSDEPEPNEPDDGDKPADE